MSRDKKGRFAKQSATTTEDNTKWLSKYWEVSKDPNEPEDHGKVFWNIPFCLRMRFAINPLPNREPTITIYEDHWNNKHRRWIQGSSRTHGLDVLRTLMDSIDEETAP